MKRATSYRTPACAVSGPLPNSSTAKTASENSKNPKVTSRPGAIANSAPATIPGRIAGKVTLNTACRREAPQITAASSID